MKAVNPWRFCIAPMMDWSDRHCRYFWRLISQHARLYTEMVTTGAILHGDAERFLRFTPLEHPIALQLGGSDPKHLAECARIAEDYGYDEVNLNCGCPSDRVQSGKIGACLMAEPELVAECYSAMQDAVHRIPVTIKHRTGIDDQDEQAYLDHFVDTLTQAGCTTFIVHARKAWLQGLSPKQNREVPPLNYQRVFDLKRKHPAHTIVINGGITSIEQSLALLAHTDGVMMGREAYHNPYVLSQVDSLLFDETTTPPPRDEVLEAFIQYAQGQITQGARLNHLTRHILGLYLAEPGARVFRRYISENACKKNAGLDVLKNAVFEMRKAKAPPNQTRPEQPSGGSRL